MAPTDPLGQYAGEGHGCCVAGLLQKYPARQELGETEPTAQYEPRVHGVGSTVPLPGQIVPAGQLAHDEAPAPTAVAQCQANSNMQGDDANRDHR